MTAPREVVWSPKYDTFCSSRESSTPASADSQNWNVSLSRATSCSLGTPAVNSERLGAATPPILVVRSQPPAPYRETYCHAPFWLGRKADKGG
jgi:hypothetical protein